MIVPKPQSIYDKAVAYGRDHFNFFRIHLTVFTLLPFIFSAIFHAANGSSVGNARDNAVGIQKVQYIDSLFLCFSAMTVTGMATVNISALRPFQQVLLFILFLCGDYSVISLVMVLVRKRYFRTHCSQLLANDQFRRTNTIQGDEENRTNLFNRAFTFNPASPRAKPREKKGKRGLISGPMDGRAMGHFIPDDEEEKRSKTQQTQIERESEIFETESAVLPPRMQESPISMERIKSRVSFRPSIEITPAVPLSAIQDELEGPAQGSLTENEIPTQQTPSTGLSHTRTIQIDDSVHPTRQYQTRQRIRSRSRGMSFSGPSPKTRHHNDVSLVQHKTLPSPLPRPEGSRNTGMGGFPNPAQLLPYIFPNRTKSTISRHLSRPALERKMTLLTNPNVAKSDDGSGSGSSIGWSDIATGAARWMPDTLASLVVGRNSRFFTEELDDEDLELIGGVEYRALRLLSYAVAAYIFLFQAIPFAILAIYFDQVKTWDSVFESSLGIQAGTINKTWLALFSTVSAYTGTGLTLTDQSMIPFRGSFLLIYVLSVVMLAGNHALPMMLRFTIWLGTKVWRKGQVNETLHFLLDHPRRCFLYLFPSHQTWFLVLVLVLFMIIEVAGFFLLQIGLPVVKFEGWTLFSDAVFQSLSVRASGFNILPVANFAPSLLFLYVILMYVAIYPIAMSIRSTNVYEERSLGVYEVDDTPADEPALQGDKSEVFSKYLAWHLRRQLAFDITPLCLAIFAICIFERGKIMDPEKSDWFTIFKIIFECTSAYSTIGLSLGTPNNNYSFCGEFGSASKLVMIGVMLRGRHRGLPVAIDRAILLPQEMARIDRKKASEASGRGQGQEQGQGLAKNE